MPSDPRVRQAMAELAAALSDLSSGDLEGLTAAVCAAIDHVDFASVSVMTADGSLNTLAPTNQIAADADALQHELHEGPCFDATTDDRAFVSENLARDHRWPLYAPKAAALGIGAQMGVDLRPPGQLRAALNLYAHTPQPFVDAVDVAEIFAAQASMMLGFADTVDQLQHALESRKTIGQALGIVMERYSIDEDRAFNFLARVSRDSNVKLRVVAADIVAGSNRRNAPADEVAPGGPVRGV